MSFEIVAPSVAQMRERIETVLTRFPWLVGEVDGQVAGYVYASPNRERAAYQWGADVAVYIGPEHRRAGLGRALYTALFDLMRSQGFFHAYAGITLPNPGSVTLHERAGFSLVGVYRNVGYKDGAWRDVGWFHLPLRELIDNPPAPRPWSELPEETIAAAFERGRQTWSGGSAT